MTKFSKKVVEGRAIAHFNGHFMSAFQKTKVQLSTLSSCRVINYYVTYYDVGHVKMATWLQKILTV